MTVYHLRRAAIGLLAGFPAGIVLGIGMRLAMRIIALADQEVPVFTIEGTLTVLLAGLILGVPAGLIFGGLEGRLRVGTGWKGPLYGGSLALLAIGALVAQALIGGPGSLGGAPGDVALIVSLFAAAFVAYGAVLEAVVNRLGPIWSRASRSATKTAINQYTAAGEDGVVSPRR